MVSAEAQVDDNQARRQAISEWLMEFSVLWAVFPILDQLIGKAPVRVGLIATSAAITFIAAAGGIILRKGEHK